MDWLNYHHLFYFYLVANEGTVSAAAELLHLARPTVTAQVRELEKSVGQPLFQKRGRHLVLTDFGQQVYEYADEIFSIGRELHEFVRTGRSGARAKFIVGMPDVVPKIIACELLKPALKIPEQPQMICVEGKLDALLADLALHRLDLVISDSPAPTHVDVRAYSHKLGECGLSFLGKAKLADQFAKQFPDSLNNAPMLLPTQQTAVRRELDRWLQEAGIRPFVVAEFEDSALLKVFGQSGAGLFPVPTAIESIVRRQYGVRVVGRLDSVREQFFAISVEKRVQHPAVLAIIKQAKGHLFDSNRDPVGESMVNG